MQATEATVLFLSNDATRLVPLGPAVRCQVVSLKLPRLLYQQHQYAHSSALATARTYTTPCPSDLNLYYDRFYQGKRDGALGFVHACDTGCTSTPTRRSIIAESVLKFVSRHFVSLRTFPVLDQPGTGCQHASDLTSIFDDQNVEHLEPWTVLTTTCGFRRVS